MQQETARERQRLADIAAENERAKKLEAQKLADIAAQNERFERLEALVMRNQCKIRESLGKME